MNTAALREQIQQAHQHEAKNGQLTQQLEQQLPHLHPAIQLPEGDAKGVLTRFVAAYIDQVPDLLDAANAVAREAGIESQIKPVLKIAEEYFTTPPKIMDGHVGLDCLLDEAYLAHRLVEEVNDLYIKHFQQPLIPLDTTVANLIAHQLIGETFANQLDEVVHHSVDNMLNDESFALESVEAYREKLSSPDTGAAWKRWPCLSRQLGVELDLK
jgi:molybdopterin converting factor small subunit